MSGNRSLFVCSPFGRVRVIALCVAALPYLALPRQALGAEDRYVFFGWLGEFGDWATEEGLLSIATLHIVALKVGLGGGGGHRDPP